jgi:hypothetical protein
MRSGSSVDVANTLHRGAVDDEAFGDRQPRGGCHRPPDLVFRNRTAHAEEAEARGRQGVAAPLNQPHRLADPI